MGLPLTMVFDGLGCFTVAASMGAVHDREITGGGKASVLNEKVRAVNTLIGNIETALTGRYHAIKFAKYGHRYLAEVQFRFNRRYDMRAMLGGLTCARSTSPSATAPCAALGACRPAHAGAQRRRAGEGGHPALGLARADHAATDRRAPPCGARARSRAGRLSPACAATADPEDADTRPPTAAHLRYIAEMKTATIPSVRVEADFRAEIEAVLAEGESLSEFVEASVRAGVERRRAQAEFIARGLRSRDEARRTGDYVDAEVALEGLQRELDAARARLGGQPK
jgi:hypothetical protein